MNKLDNLRPEVREAVRYGDEVFDDADNGWWETIRAELLRLAKAEFDLRLALQDRLGVQDEYAVVAKGWQERAEKAEAELAALKARIAGSHLVPLTKVALGNGYSLTVSAPMSVNDVDELCGKRVRLVVEE